MTTTGVCQSCGSADELLLQVRRYYVTPEAWDTPGSVTAGDEEAWCFACRTHYPHEVLDAADAADATNATDATDATDAKD